MLRTIKVFLLIGTSILLWNCSDSEPEGDFREQWVGTYEGTKSNRSFVDNVFTTPISFDVSIDESAVDHIIVNGISFEVDDDGNYGPDFLDGGSIIYTLRINDGELRLESNVINVVGLALPCFIIANKI